MMHIVFINLEPDEEAASKLEEFKFEEEAECDRVETPLTALLYKDTKI